MGFKKYLHSEKLKLDRKKMMYALRNFLQNFDGGQCSNGETNNVYCYTYGDCVQDYMDTHLLDQNWGGNADELQDDAEEYCGDLSGDEDYGPSGICLGATSGEVNLTNPQGGIADLIASALGQMITQTPLYCDGSTYYYCTSDDECPVWVCEDMDDVDGYSCAVLNYYYGCSYMIEEFSLYLYELCPVTCDEC